MEEREAVAVATERPLRGAGEPAAVAIESLEQLAEVGDDEAARGGRRRGADVGSEVAQRSVLLVPDR